MFGVIRPCRNRLGTELRNAWMAHLCGMCLALRDEHGQLARVVTNYDAVVISALIEAQAGPNSAAGRRRAAGPCPLRGMQTASVAAGDGARLAASVSLLLASAKITDHVADGDVDGALRIRAARRVARRFAMAGARTGGDLDLDAAALLATVAEQRAVEHAPSSLLAVTAPTEAATALAFRHTALVAGRPGNAEPLAEAGRLFGRLAHLLDAVEDLHADRASEAWNPIDALGLAPAEVRAHCDDALLGIRLALRDAQFADERLVHVLLVHELSAAVDRTFTAAAGAPKETQAWPPQAPAVASEHKHGPLRGCFGWLLACGTCQVCCANEFDDPCTGQRRHGACRGGDCCDCCDCCEGCGDCCECASCCDCSC